MDTRTLHPSIANSYFLHTDSSEKAKHEQLQYLQTHPNEFIINTSDIPNVITYIEFVSRVNLPTTLYFFVYQNGLIAKCEIENNKLIINPNAPNFDFAAVIAAPDKTPKVNQSKLQNLNDALKLLKECNELRINIDEFDFEDLCRTAFLNESRSTFSIDAIMGIHPVFPQDLLTYLPTLISKISSNEGLQINVIKRYQENMTLRTETDSHSAELDNNNNGSIPQFKIFYALAAACGNNINALMKLLLDTYAWKLLKDIRLEQLPQNLQDFFNNAEQLKSFFMIDEKSSLNLFFFDQDVLRGQKVSTMKMIKELIQGSQETSPFFSRVLKAIGGSFPNSHQLNQSGNSSFRTPFNFYPSGFSQQNPFAHRFEDPIVLEGEDYDRHSTRNNNNNNSGTTNLIDEMTAEFNAIGLDLGRVDAEDDELNSADNSSSHGYKPFGPARP